MMSEWRNQLTAYDAIVGVLQNTSFCGQLESKKAYSGDDVAMLYEKWMQAETELDKIEKRMAVIAIRNFVVSVTPKAITHNPETHIRIEARQHPLRHIFDIAKRQLINENN